MRRIVYLWVPHLHTRVEQGWDAALKGQPVVVAAGRFQRGIVVDASPEAEAMGVGAGMTWRHAHRRCPAARFLRYERPRYAPVIEQIGALLTRFTPWAELLPGSEEEFFLDLGAGDLTAGMRAVSQIQAEIAAELRLETRAALATGKFPARTLCRANLQFAIYNSQFTIPDAPHSMDTASPGSLLAADEILQIANCKLQIVNLRAALAPLSIDFLWDLKPEVRERMLLLGIRTLGQLAALPQRLLVDQFGPAGRWYRLLARGIDHRRVASWQPSPTLEELCLLEGDEPALPVLEAVVDDLAARLSERLVQAGYYARTLTLIAHLEGGERRFATHFLKAPVHLRRHLSQAAAALLPRLRLGVGGWGLGVGGDEEGSASDEWALTRDAPSAPIPNPQPPTPIALELHVGGLAMRGVLQLSIFGGVERGPALRAAVARIQDRFGERAVRNAVQLIAELPLLKKGVGGWGLGVGVDGESRVARRASRVRDHSSLADPSSSPPTPNP